MIGNTVKHIKDGIMKVLVALFASGDKECSTGVKRFMKLVKCVQIILPIVIVICVSFMFFAPLNAATVNMLIASRTLTKILTISIVTLVFFVIFIDVND